MEEEEERGEVGEIIMLGKRFHGRRSLVRVSDVRTQRRDAINGSNVDNKIIAAAATRL